MRADLAAAVPLHLRPPGVRRGAEPPLARMATSPTSAWGWSSPRIGRSAMHGGWAGARCGPGGGCSVGLGGAAGLAGGNEPGAGAAKNTARRGTPAAWGTSSPAHPDCRKLLILIVAGHLAAIRNSLGDAHGRGRRPVRPQPRQCRTRGESVLEPWHPLWLPLGRTGKNSGTDQTQLLSLADSRTLRDPTTFLDND